jgi:hypothetical protein
MVAASPVGLFLDAVGIMDEFPSTLPWVWEICRVGGIARLEASFIRSLPQVGLCCAARREFCTGEKLGGWSSACQKIMLQ